jgi:exodeoxyribonuclease-3
VQLRVVTYNVLDDGRGRAELIVEILRDIAADLIVLQEVFGEDLVRRIGEALGMQYFVARGNSKYHLAVLSRWPIRVRHSHHPFPPIQQTVLEAVIDCPNGRSLAVLGVHPVPRPLVFCEWWRRWELRVALRWLEPYQPSGCLLLGDFNASAPGDAPDVRRLGLLNRACILLQGQRIYRWAIRGVLDAGLVDCFRTLHPDTDGFTYGPPAPSGRIDYIFASASLASCLTKCFVAREPAAVDRASDHYPVVAEFDL